MQDYFSSDEVDRINRFDDAEEIQIAFSSIAYTTTVKQPAATGSIYEKKYCAVWYPKTKYNEPSDESQTRGDSIEYLTPSIEGGIFALDNGDWRYKEIFDTEAAALAWLKNKAGITEAA
jgi:hypothetical protein